MVGLLLTVTVALVDGNPAIVTDEFTVTVAEVLGKVIVGELLIVTVAEVLGNPAIVTLLLTVTVAEVAGKEVI